jgi:predicted glycosyltransferase
MHVNRADTRRIAFMPAHPAQVWLLRPIAAYVEQFAEVEWILREKDISAPLARHLGLGYRTISRAASGLLGNAAEFAGATASALRLTRELELDAWVTKYGPGNLAALLSGGRSISFNDDDADIVPFIAWTSYPASTVTAVTDVTRMGLHERRAVRFPGFLELCYLHPSRFEPDPTIYDDLGLERGARFAIVRLSSLQSHHDVGVRGIGEALLRKLLALAAPEIRVFITSEKALSEELEPFRSPIAVHRIHHALAFAEFVIGDSQTMTAEAAVLGTPAFRLNDFVGRISYLSELERYQLAHGFRPGQEPRLLAAVESLLVRGTWRDEYQRRRRVMLADKIDPVPWFGEVVKMVIEGRSRREIRDRAGRLARAALTEGRARRAAAAEPG